MCVTLDGGNLLILLHQSTFLRRKSHASPGHRSTYIEGGVQRFDQRPITEWLVKTIYGVSPEHAPMGGSLPVTGDENDRHSPPLNRQFFLEIGPGHARHADIKE